MSIRTEKGRIIVMAATYAFRTYRDHLSMEKANAQYRTDSNSMYTPCCSEISVWKLFWTVTNV